MAGVTGDPPRQRPAAAAPCVSATRPATSGAGNRVRIAVHDRRSDSEPDSILPLRPNLGGSGVFSSSSRMSWASPASANDDTDCPEILDLRARVTRANVEDADRYPDCVDE